MRFKLRLLFLTLFLYHVTSTSEYSSFSDTYCFPVNESLNCTTSEDCQELCSDLSLSCCGFYFSINRDGFAMCSCSEQLKIYGSQPSLYKLHLPLESLNTISCENIKRTSAVCDYHQSCEYSDNTCVPESDSESSAVFILGVVFLSICAVCTIGAAYVLYNCKLRRVVSDDLENLPPSPRPYESPREPEQGEPELIFPPEGEGSQHIGARHGEQPPYETPRTPIRNQKDGGGEELDGEAHGVWYEAPAAIGIAAPAENEPGESSALDSDDIIPGEPVKRTPEREPREKRKESLVYRL